MPTPLQDYLARLVKEYKTGVTTEHSLRHALVELLTSLKPLNRSLIDEPKRIACGVPDIVLLNKENTPVAYIETKDIGDSDLRGTKQNKEQFDRYRQGLDLVVFTDFLRFLLYQSGEYLMEVRLVDKESREGQKLLKQLGRMKYVLMSDVSPTEFADWYAQTLVYGLFAARYHDEPQKGLGYVVCI